MKWQLKTYLSPCASSSWEKDAALARKFVKQVSETEVGFVTEPTFHFLLV